jgi:N4-gp56 family major capsid protein
MAPVVNTELSQLIPAYYKKRSLARMYPNLKLYEYAEKYPLPQGEGNTITFHKFTEFSSIGSALTEGVAPTATSLSLTSITATIAQRGDYMPISDILTLTSIEPIVEAAADVYGERAALTVDLIIHEALFGSDITPLDGDHMSLWVGGKQYGLCAIFVSTSGKILALSGPLALGPIGVTYTTAGNPESFYSGVSAQSATSAGEQFKLQYHTALGAVKFLEACNAPKYEDGTYIGVAHPLALANLRSDNRFMEWSTNQRAEKGEKAIIGTFGGIKWASSTNMLKSVGFMSGFTASSLSITFAYIGGPEALAVTEIEGGYKIYVKSPNDYDTSNPLNQWSTVGYKISMAATVLNKKRAVLLGNLI